MNDTHESGMEPLCVPHATIVDGAHAAIRRKRRKIMALNEPLGRVSLALLAISGVGTLNTALAADSVCIDYYTIGESKCQPKASTPIRKPSANQAPQLIAPTQQNDVDKYLADYGKPPREFVEFYLNPTSENAQKWVETYQQLLQKGQNLSKAWNDAETLYNGQGAPAGKASAVSTPAPAQAVVAAPVAAAPSAPSIAPAANIGAFAQSGGVSSLGGIESNEPHTKLTYFFSKVCPYCARMTPDLSILSKEKEGKLEFTCVDVTPVGQGVQPEPSYITSQLPCKWRLPEPGEVESQQVMQTPTLLIQKAGGAVMRLSGYVPLAQLRSYF